MLGNWEAVCGAGGREPPASAWWGGQGVGYQPVGCESSRCSRGAGGGGAASTREKGRMAKPRGWEEPPEDRLLKTGPVGFLLRLPRGAGNGRGDWAGPSELRTWTTRFLQGRYPGTLFFFQWRCRSSNTSPFTLPTWMAARSYPGSCRDRAVLLALWTSEAGGYMYLLSPLLADYPHGPRSVRSIVLFTYCLSSLISHPHPTPHGNTCNLTL